jgi:signal transduction histidine kinase
MNSDPVASLTNLTEAQKWANHLLRTKEGLQEELQKAQQTVAELKHRLGAAETDGRTERKARRAALNLMEDAFLARAETLAVNLELQQKIGEHERAEGALRESELRLQLATEQLRRLQIDFDQRVEERTQELQQREERLRELAEQLKRIEQKDRQRLASLLHDQVQQLLIAAKIRVDNFANNPEAVLLEDVMSVLDEAINTTREVAVQLTPPLLHDLGLPAALEWLISRMTKQFGLIIKSKLDEQANPPIEEYRDILFQAAQEFLLNAIKHANTKIVILRLVRIKDRICLKVCDRGNGFDVAKNDLTHGSFGLFQLRNRLGSIGGKLKIKSFPGQGTCVGAQIPHVTVTDIVISQPVIEVMRP